MSHPFESRLRLASTEQLATTPSRKTKIGMYRERERSQRDGSIGSRKKFLVVGKRVLYTPRFRGLEF